MDTAVQAVVGWLSWITEQERQQIIRPSLPYLPTQYLHHLQVTYEVYTRYPDGTQEMNEAASHQKSDQETPSVTSMAVTDTCTD